MVLNGGVETWVCCDPVCVSCLGSMTTSCTHLTGIDRSQLPASLGTSAAKCSKGCLSKHLPAVLALRSVLPSINQLFDMIMVCPTGQLPGVVGREPKELETGAGSSMGKWNYMGDWLLKVDLDKLNIPTLGRTPVAC